MSGKALHIIGAGGHAKLVIAAAMACGYTDISLFDDDPAKQRREVMGIPVTGVVPDSKGIAPVFLAIGDNHLRQKMADLFHDREWARLVHPSASVDDTVFIGGGTIIGPQAVVNADARIESQAILNSGCVVEHDCRVGNYVHVGPNATMTGGCEVGDFTLIGAGATLLPNIVVVGQAVIGAGSVVTDHVSEGQVVTGVPAKPQ